MRLLVPQLLLALFLFLNVASLPLPPPLPHADTVKAHLVLMAIYYWAIYRPTLVPPWQCFLVGLVMDILNHTTLGLNAIVLLIVQLLVRDQRKFLMGQPYIVIWAVYGLVAVCASCMQWGLHGLMEMRWVPIMPVLSGAAISLFLFPFVTILLVLTHRILPHGNRNFASLNGS